MPRIDKYFHNDISETIKLMIINTTESREIRTSRNKHKRAYSIELSIRILLDEPLTTPARRFRDDEFSPPVTKEKERAYYVFNLQTIRIYGESRSRDGEKREAGSSRNVDTERLDRKARLL